MDKEQIKRQILAKTKPTPRPVPVAEGKALLARYGQTYNPAGSPTATSEEESAE